MTREGDGSQIKQHAEYRISKVRRDNRQWTPAQLDVLIEMYEAGASAAKIAEVLGCSIEKVTLKMTAMEMAIRSPKIALPPSDWSPNLSDEKLYPS